MLSCDRSMMMDHHAAHKMRSVDHGRAKRPAVRAKKHQTPDTTPHPHVTLAFLPLARPGRDSHLRLGDPFLRTLLLVAQAVTGTHPPFSESIATGLGSRRRLFQIRLMVLLRFDVPGTASCGRAWFRIALTDPLLTILMPILDVSDDLSWGSLSHGLLALSIMLVVS